MATLTKSSKGPISQFILHNYRHFNAAALVDAAKGYETHMNAGGKMLVTLAGAMSTAELGLTLAEMIRQDKVSAICCTGANLEEDIFNLVAHEHYIRVPNYRDLTPQDEQKLLEKHMNRVTDTCIPEMEAMRRIESAVLEEWVKADKNNEYYVELVGTGIRLVLVDSLITPESYIQTMLASYEETLFDQGGYETKNVGPQSPEYFLINRSSLDINAWSRVNRWFHVDVIRATETYNKIQIDLTPYTRGRRPILEYDPDIALYNHGTLLFDVIDLIDNTTTDPLSDLVYTGVESSLASKLIDGVELANGFRVVFTAATDSSVRNKIYTVQLGDFLSNNIRRISLHDTGKTITNNSNIIVVNGTVKKGVTYVLKNGVILTAQQKTRVNQPPLFDLFDSNGISYSDNDIYPETTFVGNKLLSYRVGFGINDSVLNMPLSYRSIGNVGDIQFENFVMTDTFAYNETSHSTANGNIYQNGVPVQTWIR
jgi:hypothetical protein